MIPLKQPAMTNNTIISLVHSSLHQQGSLSLPYNLLLSLYKKDINSFLIAWLYLKEECHIPLNDEKSYHLIYSILTLPYSFTAYSSEVLEQLYVIAEQYWDNFTHIQKEKIIEQSMKMPYIWQHKLVSLTKDASFFAAYSTTPVVYLKAIHHVVDVWTKGQNTDLQFVEEDIIKNGGQSFLSIIAHQSTGVQQYVHHIWDKPSIFSSVVQPQCTSCLESNVISLKILSNIFKNFLHQFPLVLPLIQAGTSCEQNHHILLEIELLYKKLYNIYPYSYQIIRHAFNYNHLVGIGNTGNHQLAFLYYQQFPEKLYPDCNQLSEKNMKINHFLNDMVCHQWLHFDKLKKSKQSDWKRYAQDIEHTNVFLVFVYVNEVLLSLKHNDNYPLILADMYILLNEIDEYLYEKTLVDTNEDLKLLCIHINKHVLSYQLQQQLFIDYKKKEKGRRTTKI